MKQSRKLYWRKDSFLSLFIIPFHKVIHQTGGFFRRSILEKLSSLCPHRVVTGLVSANMDSIGICRAIRKSPILLIILPEHDLMKLSDEYLG
jgi:hypothetical protein